MELIFIIVAALFIGLLIFFLPQVGLIFILLGTLFLPEMPVGYAMTSVAQAGQGRPIGIRPEDFFLIIVCLGWFAGLIARRRPLHIPYTPLNIPLVAMSVVIIITTAWGIFNETAPRTAGFFYALKRIQYFLVFFMVIVNVRTFRQVKVNTFILLFFSSIVAIWAVVEHITIAPVRLAGPFQETQPVLLGGFFLITVFLSLAYFFRYRLIQTRLAISIILLLSAYAVVFTRSRATYVALIIGLILFGLISRKTYFLVIPLLLFVMMRYLSPAPVKETFESIRGVWVRGVNTSWEARVDSWEMSVPMILNHPLLGHGHGSFALSWADNQYVTDALYMGIIGVVAFIWVLVRIYRNVYPLIKTGDIDRQSDRYYLSALALGCICGLNALVIHGIAVSTFYTIRIMIPFWFVIGLVMIGRNLLDSEIKPIATPPRYEQRDFAATPQ